MVTCEATGRQESFDISDIIGYDMMSYYYYGTYTETDFDGESLLTSAIDSVLTGVTRMVYELSLIHIWSCFRVWPSPLGPPLASTLCFSLPRPYCTAPCV